MSRPLAALSIDLDALGCYHAIHGLGDAPEASSGAILRAALPRFLAVLERRKLRATFFVVAGDLERDGGRAAVAEIALAGHEVGNHTLSHRYELVRLPRQVIEAEVRRAHELLAEAAGAGHAPVGFRAPGYGLTASLLEVLADVGYRYDSSMFPSWPYYALKAALLGAMRVEGRRSASILSDPRQLLAPAEPYRPDVRRPWRRGQAPLVELPVAVAPGTRLPAIGTTLLAAPAWLRARLLGAMRGRRFFNLELHGIDLCDAEGDGVAPALVSRRPDLRVPLGERLRALDAVLDRVALDFEFVTLREAAALVQRDGRIG